MEEQRGSRRPLTCGPCSVCPCLSGLPLAEDGLPGPASGSSVAKASFSHLVTLCSCPSPSSLASFPSLSLGSLFPLPGEPSPRLHLAAGSSSPGQPPALGRLSWSLVLDTAGSWPRACQVGGKLLASLAQPPDSLVWRWPICPFPDGVSGHSMWGSRPGPCWQ